MKKVNIDKEQFEKLCSIMCTGQEIASFFNVKYDDMLYWCKHTYHKNFSVVYEQKSALGKISLRRMQFKHANSNPVMAIWLGKQYLGQTDKVESSVEERIEVVNDVPKDIC